MIFYCLCFLVLYYNIGNSEGIQPKLVNVNLETILQFDKVHNKEDVELIEGIQRLLGKIKQVITTNASRRNNEVSIKFSDYLVKTIDLLIKMGDRELRAIFQALKEQYKKNEYNDTKFVELLDNDVLRNVVSDVLERLSKASPRDIRKWLIAAKKKIELKHPKVKGLVEYINALYGEKDLKKIEELTENLNIFKDSKRKSIGDLKEVVNDGLKSIVFDHYSHLNDDTRRTFKVWLDYFVNDFNFQNPEKESLRIATTSTIAPFLSLVSQFLSKQIGRVGTQTQQLKEVYNHLKDNVLKLQEITFTNENPLTSTDEDSDSVKIFKTKKRNKKRLRYSSSEDEIHHTTKLYSGETTEEENNKHNRLANVPYKTRDIYDDDEIESKHDDEQIKFKVNKRSKKTTSPVSTTKSVIKVNTIKKSYEEDDSEETSSDFEEKWTNKNKKSIKTSSPVIPRTTKRLSKVNPIRIHKKKILKTSEEDDFEETSSDIEDKTEQRTTKSKRPMKKTSPVSFRTTKRVSRFNPIRIHKKIQKTSEEHDFKEISSDIEKKTDGKRTIKRKKHIEKTSKTIKKVNRIRIQKRDKKTSDKVDFEDTSSGIELEVTEPTINTNKLTKSRKKSLTNYLVWKPKDNVEGYIKKDSFKRDNTKKLKASPEKDDPAESTAESDPFIRDSIENDEASKIRNINNDSQGSDDGGGLKNKGDDAANDSATDVLSGEDVNSIFKVEVFPSVERTSKKNLNDRRNKLRRDDNKNIEDICNNIRRNEPDSGTEEGLSIETFYSNDTAAKPNNGSTVTVNTTQDKDPNSTTKVAVDIVRTVQPSIESKIENIDKSKEDVKKYLSQRRNSILQGIPLQEITNEVKSSQKPSIELKDEKLDNKEDTTTVAEKIISTTIEGYQNATLKPFNGKNESEADLIANKTLQVSTQLNNVTNITESNKELQNSTKPDIVRDNNDSLNNITPDDDIVASKEVSFDYDIKNKTQHSDLVTDTIKNKETPKVDLTKKMEDDLKDLEMEFSKGDPTGGLDFEVTMH